MRARCRSGRCSRSWSMTGRAKPARWRRAPRARSSAKGATRGEAPPVSSDSASGEALAEFGQRLAAEEAARNRPSGFSARRIWARAPGRSLTQCSASAETTRSRLAGREGQASPRRRRRRDAVRAKGFGKVGRGGRPYRPGRSAASRSARSGSGLPISAASGKWRLHRGEAVDQVVGDGGEQEIGARRRAARARGGAARSRRASVEDVERAGHAPSLWVLAAARASKPRPDAAVRGRCDAASPRSRRCARLGLMRGDLPASHEPAGRLRQARAGLRMLGARLADLALPPHCLACERPVASARDALCRPAGAGCG